jgi:membrane protease YdiL (CAAX protease family)
MDMLLPWIRVALAVLVYVLFAIASSIVARKAGADLKEMEGRSSQRNLIIGAVANLCVLVVILLMLVFLDGRPVGSIGVSFFGRDLVFSILAVALIFLSAVAFVVLLGRSRNVQVMTQSPVQNSAQSVGLVAAAAVLMLVAVQEEVLYRGYITVNLIEFGPAVVFVTSIVLFTAIHLLTNRASVYQILSWLLGGAVLTYAYLVSGSIWVAIVLHFATDLANLLVFNIIGQYSLFKISPALTVRHRAFYRAAYVAVVVGVLLVFFGPSIKAF